MPDYDVIPDHDDLTSMELYRNLVLQYEAAHAEINALFQGYPGGTETMPEQDFRHYRELARKRDELLNEMRVLEQELLDDQLLDDENIQS